MKYKIESQKSEPGSEKRTLNVFECKEGRLGQNRAADGLGPSDSTYIIHTRVVGTDCVSGCVCTQRPYPVESFKPFQLTVISAKETSLLACFSFSLVPHLFQ